MNNKVNSLIDSLRFRTYNKVYRAVKKRFPNIEDDELKEIISKRLHDKRPPNRIKRLYQVKIFSRFRGAWFTDLMVNGKDEKVTPNINLTKVKYWQIFINTNTRYATAYPLEDKTSESIRKNLEKFVQLYHPRKITSDEEAGFTSKDNMNYLKQNKCGVFIVQEQLHSTLGIIDRFIRTLRDMNTPQEKPLNADSSDKQFTFITPQKMKRLLESYNNTVHSATKMTPKEMMDNPELEEDYIIKCVENLDRQSRIKDFKLKIGDYVRFLIAKDKFGKRRYTVSRESYKIDQALRNMYTIIAKDGTTLTLPRWRLFKVNEGENKRWGKTLGSDKGIIDKVLSREGNKFNVRFKYLDGTKKLSKVNVRELRMPFPQIPSKYET